MNRHEKTLHKVKKKLHRKVLAASAAAGTVPGFVGTLV